MCSKNFIVSVGCSKMLGLQYEAHISIGTICLTKQSGVNCQYDVLEPWIFINIKPPRSLDMNENMWVFRSIKDLLPF
jgi:hypothetical protein